MKLCGQKDIQFLFCHIIYCQLTLQRITLKLGNPTNISITFFLIFAHVIGIKCNNTFLMIQTFITMRITKMSMIQSLPLSLNEGRQTQTGNVYHYHVHDEEKLRFQLVVLPKLTLRLLLTEKVQKNMIRPYSKLKIHLLKFQGVVLILNHLGGILM